MESIVLSIDGRKIACKAGTSIFDAAGANGIKIPSLCYHPELKPHGACRLCLVEDEASGRLFASCVTPAARDMAIRTGSPRVVKHRKNIVRLLMAEHPESCIVCSKGNRCELRGIAAQLGLGENSLYPMPNYKPFEAKNPFIARDLSKCVLCGRCIRADQELVCVGAIDYNNRGFPSRPATVHEVPLEESSCTFCGTCVSVCPTGALSVQDSRHAGAALDEGLTVCGFCAIGCSLRAGKTGEKVVEVHPAAIADTANRSTLCVRGHFAHDFLNSSERLATPLLRQGADEEAAALAPASWEEAIGHVVSRLSDIKRNHGPKSIAFIGSGKSSIEENYLFQKLARAIFQTPHITCAGESGCRDTLFFLDDQTGGRFRIHPLSELESAEAILMLGPDPDHAAPVMGYHIKRAAKKGATLIAVDPLPNAYARFADQWIRPEVAGHAKSSLSALLTLLCREILVNGGEDEGFISSRTDGYEAYRKAVTGLDRNTLAESAGISVDEAEKAAAHLSGKRIAIIIGSLQNRLSMEANAALFNLALATGSLGSEGAGIYLAGGDANWMGAADMGVDPSRLPGRKAVSERETKEALEAAWKTTIPSEPGLCLAEIVEAAENGSLKAVYIMGENPVRQRPQSERVASALSRLDLLVVQDIVSTRTSSLADVVLPGAAQTEKAGAFTNLEGRIQSFTQLVEPPGQAKPDWEIISSIASGMGYPEPYTALTQVKQEIRRLVPAYADLGGHRQGWIKNADGGTEGPFSFLPPALGHASASSQDYPYTGILSGLRYHMGCGTRTARSERIEGFAERGRIAVSAADAESLSLSEGMEIRLESPFGAIERGIRIDYALSSGQVFIPTGFYQNSAVDLLDPAFPASSDTPGWEVCPVRIEKSTTKREV